MSSFAEDMAVAIAAELDRHHEAGPLAAALQALFSEALADQHDDFTATATADGTVVVEDSGSGDGGTLVRDGNKWWLKQPSWATPADPSEQHFEDSPRKVPTSRHHPNLLCQTSHFAPQRRHCSTVSVG